MTNGIDYGNGLTNIDHATGIRYGVILHHDVGESWYESSEADYGKPHCHVCGNEATTSDTIDDESVLDSEWFTGKDFTCTDCERCFWSDEAFGDEPLAHTFADADYEASQTDSDIFVTRSPFYTYAPFCSPCAPGACYLRDGLTTEYGETDADGNLSAGRFSGLPKAYCFGHEWFDGGKAPYRVFRVADDTEVFPDQA